MASCSAAVNLAQARRRSIVLEGQRQTERLRDFAKYDKEGIPDSSSAAAAALTVKLDGLKLTMDPDLDGPGWTATVDLDDLRQVLANVSGQPHHRRHNHTCPAAAAAVATAATAPEPFPGFLGPSKSKILKQAVVKKCKNVARKLTKIPGFDLDDAIIELEAANEELTSRNSLYRLKNEMLMVNISEKRLSIARMHWEMLELREVLDTEMDAHFLENNCCHGHLIQHPPGTCGPVPLGGGGGGKAKKGGKHGGGGVASGGIHISCYAAGVAAAAADSAAAAATLLPPGGGNKSGKKKSRRRK